MEGGDQNSQQYSSAPESSGIPDLLLPVVPASAAPSTVSVWHEHPLVSPLLIRNIGNYGPTGNITYSEIFSILSNVELHDQSPLPPPPASTLLPMTEHLGGFEKGESSTGTKRRSDFVEVPHARSEAEMEQKRKRDSDDLQQQQPPRSRRRRSPHLHNMSERTRRHRIAEKIATLQELIPNCNKTDKSSVLSDAIEYIKLLQHQVQMMFMYQSMAVPYYSSFFPMRPMMPMGYGMGMLSSAYGTGFPVVPSAGINPRGESGSVPVSQVQFPVHTTSQPNQATSIGITSATPSTSATTLSHTLREPSSHSIPSIGSEFYHIPITDQVPRPRGSIAMVEEISTVAIARPQSFSGGVDEEVQKFHHDSSSERR